MRTRPITATGTASLYDPYDFKLETAVPTTIKPPERKDPNDKAAAILSNFFIGSLILTLYHKVRDCGGLKLFKKIYQALFWRTICSRRSM